MKLTNNLYFYPEQGMLDCNTYVITGNPGTIIDPGNPAFLPALVNSLHKDGIDPQSIGIITNTHLHGDHCGANEAFKELSGARIAIHPVQKKFYKLVVIDGARLLGIPPRPTTRTGGGAWKRTNPSSGTGCPSSWIIRPLSSGFGPCLNARWPPTAGPR